MSDHRKKNMNWYVADDNGELYHSNGDWVAFASLAVLMDLRDELQAMRRRLDCHETLSIPHLLREIRANTAKPKHKPKLKVAKRRAT